MALTMTRTRTQTTLNKLALMVANVHGELAFVQELCSELKRSAAPPTPTAKPQLMLMRIEARALVLQRDKEALYATVRQFDPTILPEQISTADDWKKAYGRGKQLREETLKAKLLSSS